MKSMTLPPETEIAIWLRILHPADGELTPQVARRILELSFPKSEIDRMHELSKKARAGILSPDKDCAMDEYERVGAKLSILKSKARQKLKQTKRSI